MAGKRPVVAICVSSLLALWAVHASARADELEDRVLSKVQSDSHAEGPKAKVTKAGSANRSSASASSRATTPAGTSVASASGTQVSGKSNAKTVAKTKGLGKKDLLARHSVKKHHH